MSFNTPMEESRMSKRSVPEGEQLASPLETGAWPDGGIQRRELLRSSAAAAFGLVVFGSLSGCGAGGAGAKKRIAFSHPDAGTGSDIFPPLLRGVKEEAAKRGYEAVIGSGGQSVERQVAEVRTWIAQRFAAVTIVARDSRALAPLVKEAKRQGTVFVAYAAPLPGAQGEVTFNNAQGARLLGEDAGRWVNEVKGGKAEVALLQLSTLPNILVRTEGAAKRLLEVAPKAKVVARQDAVLAPDTLKATQSILQAHPNVSVIICVADDGALGARQAVLEQGKDPASVYVGGSDGGKRNIELILKGNDPIKASAALDLVEIGRQSIAIPANIVEGKGPSRWAAPYTLVTPQQKAVARRMLAQYEA